MATLSYHDNATVILMSKNYIRTSENEFLSARARSVYNIRYSEKIHKHLEMPKWFYELPPFGDYDTCEGGSQFSKGIKAGFARS